MPGLILYSTNPWFAHDISMRYRRGVHFAWVSEYFDCRTAPTGTPASFVAPSANPCQIYRNLREDVGKQDSHSALINGYRKKFVRLARDWFSSGLVTKDQHDEIIAAARAHSWTIWKPVLYVIPSERIMAASRLITVPRKVRASHGMEYQIADLLPHEFDILELDIL
jgi:hypothetical protein